MRWFGRRDRDYREELDTHIEIEVRENLERGMAPDAARQAALRTFGNALAVRERLQEARPFRSWEVLLRDIRYGTRLLARTPALTATIVLTLALGIGANAAIFSLVEAVLLRMLPVKDPHSLVIVRALTRQGVRDWFSHKDYEWLRDHNQAFSGLAATANWKLTLDSGDRKERVGVEFVSGNYFSMLGIDPAAGRVIELEDEHQRRPVAVISHAYWQRAFGGNADALGKQLHLEKGAFEIAGVAPAGFRGEYDGDPPDLWLPLTTQGVISRRSFLNTRNASWLGILGRLRPGLNVQSAQAEMRPLLESLRRDLHVDAQNDYLGGIGIEPGGAGLSNIRDYYGRPLRVLMALVVVVLLIACSNVANLLLARAEARRREFAVRLAIGASRWRLLRQLLTESFLLSGFACVTGLAIAYGIVRALVGMAGVKGLDVHLDSAVLAFTIGISFAAAVAFGMVPALQGNRVDPWTTLKEGKLSGGGSIQRLKLSSLLVVAQSAFSVVLLIAAGLLLRTFWNLKSLNPGFDQTVIEAQLDTSLVSENGVALGNRIVERLSSVRGVQAASYSQFGFGQGSNRVCCIAIEGYTPEPNEDKNVRLQPVSPGYFHAEGIPLLAGREFTATDRYNAPKVAVINETTARHYFGGVNPLGKRFAWWPTDLKNIEIVGVAKDAKYDNLKEQTPRLVYVSILQEGPGPNFVQIRALAGGRSADTLFADCRAVILSVNPNIRITSFAPASAAVKRTMRPELLVSSVSTGFGILGLLLTSVGLYGVLAYAVARRTSEFGIRMALGAETRTIRGMVMSEGLVLVAAGVVGGTLIAASLSHLVTKLLFGVPANDWATFASAAVALLVVAAVASYWPARRATGVEPVAALRHE